MGIGFGPLPRSCTKWMGIPSISVRKFARRFISASCARQS